MKAATINEIKQELTTIPPKRLLELCLRLARFKKENKELLTYLLFEAGDETGFVEGVKKEIDEQFEEIPTTNWYFIKKSIRKILKTINKYSKYTNAKESQIEMLLYFMLKLKSSTVPIQNNKTLSNLYTQQLKKLDALIKSVHTDLHYDYNKQLELLK